MQPLNKINLSTFNTIFFQCTVLANMYTNILQQKQQVPKPISATNHFHVNIYFQGAK